MKTGNRNCCEKINAGVNCDVKNCVYHRGEYSCIAEKIVVGPGFATTATETICATFKAKRD